MKDWKEIVKNSERYSDFIILDEPMSFKEFATDHGDIDLVQVHSTSVMELSNGECDIVGFAGQFRWRNNRLIPLDGDTYNEDMTVLGYDWFYPVADTHLLSGECLDILVGDDW